MKYGAKINYFCLLHKCIITLLLPQINCGLNGLRLDYGTGSALSKDFKGSYGAV
jgi:hypothetical protein